MTEKLRARASMEEITREIGQKNCVNRCWSKERSVLMLKKGNYKKKTGLKRKKSKKRLVQTSYIISNKDNTEVKKIDEKSKKA